MSFDFEMVRILTRYQDRLTALLCFGMTCCSSYLNDFTFYNEIDKHELKKLNINGMYYVVYPRSCSGYYDFQKQSSNMVDWYIFYENGFFLSIGIDSPNFEKDPEKTITEFINSERGKRYQSNAGNWGSYVVHSDSLFMQQVTSVPFRSFVISNRARILNDSTLEFDRGRCFSNPSAARIYHFKKSGKKPDSLNVFQTNRKINRKLERNFNKRHGKK